METCSGEGRVCRRCGERKEPGSFSPKHVDCKQCRSEVEKARYHRNPGPKREYQRQYGREHDRSTYRKAWQDRNREAVRANTRKHYRLSIDRQPTFNDAHRLLKEAVRCGDVVRPDSCQVCGRSCKPEGHHADYRRPYDVVWVCRTCHSSFRGLRSANAGEE